MDIDNRNFEKENFIAGLSEDLIKEGHTGLDQAYEIAETVWRYRDIISSYL